MIEDPVIKSWAIAAQSTQAMLYHVPTENMRRIFQHIEALTAERDRLALAICGGEDAPDPVQFRTPIGRTTMTDLRRRINRDSYNGGDYRDDLHALKIEDPRLSDEIDSILAAIDRALALTDEDTQTRDLFAINMRADLARAAVQPDAAEYERKVAQMKADFPNGI
jgi:hypothetical protein